MEYITHGSDEDVIEGCPKAAGLEESSSNDARYRSGVRLVGAQRIVGGRRALPSHAHQGVPLLVHASGRHHSSRLLRPSPRSPLGSPCCACLKNRCRRVPRGATATAWPSGSRRVPWNHLHRAPRGATTTACPSRTAATHLGNCHHRAPLGNRLRLCIRVVRQNRTLATWGSFIDAWNLVRLNQMQH
jgi:hypothetical protein